MTKIHKAISNCIPCMEGQVPTMPKLAPNFLFYLKCCAADCNEAISPVGHSFTYAYLFNVCTLGKRLQNFVYLKVTEQVR